MHIGQKVECIRAYHALSIAGAAILGVTCPTKGVIYTIRDIIIPMAGYPDCVLLHELSNPVVRWMDGTVSEAGFYAHDFRPITDISALTKLTKVRELEDA